MEFGSFLTMVLIGYGCYYAIAISWEVLGHKTPAKAAVSGKINFTLAEQPVPVKVTQSLSTPMDAVDHAEAAPASTLEDLPGQDDQELEVTAGSGYNLLEDLGLETITDGEPIIVTEDNIRQLLGEGSIANL